MASVYPVLYSVMVLHLGLFTMITQAEMSRRERRSDDTNALEPVVSMLSQKVDLLTAQLAAQDANFKNQIQLLKNQDASCKDQIDLLKARFGVAEELVAFTAYFTETHQHGFGVGQMLKFDTVSYNVGSAYNTASGFFTAPSNGTYVFFVHLTHSWHEGANDEGTAEVDLYQDSSKFMQRVIACCQNMNAGSNLLITHLTRGQTMHVQIAKGSMFLGGSHTTFSAFKLSPL